MVQLDEALLALLDKHAARTGIPRRPLIRFAIDDYLQQHPEANEDFKAMLAARDIEAYARFPDTGLDPHEWDEVWERMYGKLPAQDEP